MHHEDMYSSCTYIDFGQASNSPLHAGQPSSYWQYIEYGLAVTGASRGRPVRSTDIERQ